MLALPALPGAPRYREKEMEAVKRNVHDKSAEQKRKEFEETKQRLRDFAKKIGRESPVEERS